MSGWDHAAVYRPASPGERQDCARECEAGNGASCLRLSRAFGSFAEKASCAEAFRKEACLRGLPQACARASDDEPSPARAFASLSALCEQTLKPGWACFYQAHSIEMLWGAPADARGPDYSKLCASPCPAPPERCYRDIACQIVREKRGR